MNIELLSTGDFDCWADLSPVASPVGGWSLTVRSRRQSARDPQAEQTRLRLCLTEEGLRRLSAGINEALRNCADHPHRSAHPAHTDLAIASSSDKPGSRS